MEVASHRLAVVKITKDQTTWGPAAIKMIGPHLPEGAHMTEIPLVVAEGLEVPLMTEDPTMTVLAVVPHSTETISRVVHSMAIALGHSEGHDPW